MSVCGFNPPQVIIELNIDSIHKTWGVVFFVLKVLRDVVCASSFRLSVLVLQHMAFTENDFRCTLCHVLYKT